MAGSIQAAGTDCWPLRVTCVECGFETHTVECFSEHRSGPPWCAFINSSETRRRSAPLQTFWRMLVPFAPWRELRLSTPVSWRHFMLWVIGALVVSWILIIGCVAVFSAFSVEADRLASVPGRIYRGSIGGSMFLKPFSSTGALEHVITGAIWTLGSFIGMLPLWCSFLLVLFVLPITRKRARVHASHVFRVVILSLLPLLIFPVLLPILALWLTLVPTTRTDSGMLLVLMTFCGVGYFACWWYGLIRCYLKLPHAMGIVISMLIIGLIIQVAIYPLLNMIRSNMI
jgi:hypothetical protein